MRRYLLAIEAKARLIHDWLSRQQSGELGRFHRSNGNDQLVDALPLNSSDVVVDAGAYEGQWADEILCRYGCRAILLEPIPTFASKLQERYAANDRVEIVEAALGNRADRVPISIAEDGSSIHLSPRALKSSIDVNLLDVSAFLEEKISGACGCLKLNIEGAEFDVLEKLEVDGKMPEIKIFLIQFHDLVPDSERRRDKIRKSLSRTHRLAFDYSFVWECWIRK